MKINLKRLLAMLARNEEQGYVFKDGKMYKRTYSLFSVKLIAAAVVCLAVLTAFGYTSMRKDILIEDITGTRTITTFKSNVGDVLAENNINIRANDRINMDMKEHLKDGLKIVITRANYITITADGKKFSRISTAATIRDILAEAQIKLSEKDKVMPALNTKIVADTDIKVMRVTEKSVTKVQTIPFKNKTIKTDKLDIGTVKVIKAGKDGKQEVSTKVTYEDGKQVASVVMGKKTLQQPVDGLIEEGTKSMLVTSRGEIKRFKKSTYMVATAYDLSYESCKKLPSHPQYGITSSGLKAREGIVAVDPRVIPLGTWLYVEGYGEALAADTGGAIKGNKIDLFFSSEKKVDQYGRKKVKVYILDKPRYKF